MEKLFKLLLAGALTLSLAACGSNAASTENKTDNKATAEPAAESSDLDFYFISLMTGGAAWSRAEKGFNDACEELGINGQFLAPVERNNLVEMVTLLDQAVTQEADAVIGVYASTETFGPSLLNAKEKGIVTASVQLKLDPQYIDFMIGTNQTQIGIEMANALLEYSGDKDTTVMFLCGSAGEVTNMQYEAFCKTLEGHDNITVLDMKFDDGAAATANQVISDEYTANPDLNAVVCLDSSAATIGAASFVEERGLQDEWTVIGIDASADILNYVKNGALTATMNQDFYKMGHDSVVMAYELIKNGTQPPFENDSGCYLIRPEDVDAYAKANGIELK